MTEVPEHLLKRSLDRRAALGLGGEGDSGGGDAAPTPAPSDAPASGAVEPAAAAPATPAAATPAAPEPAPEPVPPYVEAALTRKKIPIWAMPVLAFIPVWAILFVGSLSEADTGELTQIELGQQIYSTSCAVCHGAAGGGGVGRPLSDGDVVATFPDLLGHLEFVSKGSLLIGESGTPYGDSNRPGGQHSTYSFNGQAMPSFASLSGADLLAVVRYEREGLSGLEVDPERLDPDGNLLWPNGEPMVDSSGNLLNPDGEPLFDANGLLTLDPNYAEPVGGAS